MPYFEGQAEVLIVNLEQAKALASSFRNEVFYCFLSKEGLSASDVAKGLGKSAQVVHYHVNELLNVGLLMAVGERKKHARQETLYAHAAVSTYTSADANNSPEYRQEIANGFASIARAMTKEMEQYFLLQGEDRAYRQLFAHRQKMVSLSPEKAIEIRAKLTAVIAEAFESHDPTSEHTVRVAVFMAPTLGTSKRQRKKIENS